MRVAPGLSFILLSIKKYLSSKGIASATEKEKHMEEEQQQQQQKSCQMISSDSTKEGEAGGGGYCCSAAPADCLGGLSLFLSTAAAAAADDDDDDAHNQNLAMVCRSITSSSATTTSSTTTTTRTSRSNFAKATTSSLFPNNAGFTNHESLPALSHALSTFTQTYPQYDKTQEADRIRDQHYSHLSNHVCLDYTGFTLFSHSQLLALLSQQPQQQQQQQLLAPSFFGISYKSAASLASQLQYGSQDSSALESAIRHRIMSFLNVSQDDYAMVCTANRSTAFKLLVEAYPFRSSSSSSSSSKKGYNSKGNSKTKCLLTVYDHESEAVTTMVQAAHRRGAKAMSADFSWPSLRIRSAKLKRALEDKKRKGLFVFPLQSRMTGARYPYMWMRMAQENGWHVALDACALGPKDMDSLALSLFNPDFIICSFYKVLGEIPSGFAALLIKKSAHSSSFPPILEASAEGTGIGIVSIVPPTDHHHESHHLSGALSDIDTASSFSGPICDGGSAPKKSSNLEADQPSTSKLEARLAERFEQGETSTPAPPAEENEIVELESKHIPSFQAERREIECTGLDHADSLGLLLISSRLRCITNWLVMALMKLRHPNPETNGGHSLVRIYGPRIKFERGPAIAFNVFDWKGEKVEPALVQKLADRSGISLGCGFLHNICFSDKYEEERDGVLERRGRRRSTACQHEITVSAAGNKKKEEIHLGIAVVNASLGFLTNFEDAYNLWSFVAKFLDADFVEKERWRYMALNQKTMEI